MNIINRFAVPILFKLLNYWPIILKIILEYFAQAYCQCGLHNIIRGMIVSTAVITL